MTIDFLTPGWWLLMIPTATILVFRAPTSPLRRCLRGLVFLTTIAALAEPIITMQGSQGMVVVVADRSLSMPPGSDRQHEEAIRLIRSNMPEDCRLAVVSFAEETFIDLPPENLPFQGFSQQTRRDGSLLSEALEKALSLIPRDTPGRILLLSDGNWTGVDPTQVVHRAGSRRIPIDFRLYKRSGLLDLAFDHIDLPMIAQPAESFLLTCWIRSPIAQEIRFTAMHNSEKLVDCRRHVPAGLSRIFLKDKAGEEGGVIRYSFQIEASASDPIPENNTAHALLGIAAPRALLVVTKHRTSAFPKMIESPGLRVRSANPSDLTWELDELTNFCCIILDNIPADTLGSHGMQNLCAWVSETGGGLLMAGGKNSFGPGGYFHSPLDPLLPVSMELRSEQRKATMAIVVAMDRSGSMSMSAGNGYTKMDLANLATVEVLDLMSQNDEFGVIAVDSSSHVVVNIQPLSTNKATLRNKILSIESEGGGIFIYEALAAALDMLKSSHAQTKHIILFADASDSEEPGQYRELLANCRKAGITVSVIGLGESSDSDASLLVDIAKHGEGAVFFTPDPQELPRIFAQDTFLVARSSFIDKTTNFSFTSEMRTLTSTIFEPPPPIGGYNLCYLRPGALIGAITNDENKAPVVAAWQAGTGRVIAYTGELDGQFTGPIANWKQTQEFFSSMAKWVAGDMEKTSWNTTITRELVNGVCRIRLLLDADSEKLPFSLTPQVMAVHARNGSKPASTTIPMEWITPEILTCDIPLVGDEVLVPIIKLNNNEFLSVPPVCLPYSPEFTPDDGMKGAMTLERLANITNGKDRLELTGIWKDIPKAKVEYEIAHWLLLCAAFLFLLEVLERRTGLLGESISWSKSKIWHMKSRNAPSKNKINDTTHDKAAITGIETAISNQNDDLLTETELGTALKLAKNRARRRSESDSK